MAFQANKSLTNITKEVFHNIVATALSSFRPQPPNSTLLLALASVLEGSHSAPSKAAPSGPIDISESKQEGSEKGNDSLIRNASPPSPARGDLVIESHPTKRAKTSTPMEANLPLSIDKGKKALEVPINLSSTLDDNCLASYDINADFMPASMTKLLWSKVFGGVPNVSNPRFLRFVCNLAYSTK